MNFDSALVTLSTYLGLDAVLLADYAEQDPHGGRDTGWSVASMTRNEGRILYALTRAMQPDTIIEIGTEQGCSTTHFLQAITDNPGGQVISIDPGANIGVGIPPALQDHWQYRLSDGVTELHKIETYTGQRQFILEDSLHSYEHTRAILDAALALDPQLLICHDVIEYPGVAQAWSELVGDKGITFTVDDAPAGMGFYAPERSQPAPKAKKAKVKA